MEFAFIIKPFEDQNCFISLGIKHIMKLKLEILMRLIRNLVIYMLSQDNDLHIELLINKHPEILKL